MAEFGKRVADRLYTHVSNLDNLDAVGASLVSEALRLSNRRPSADFNVVRISEDKQEVALLNYQRFFEDAFPSLTHSWRIHVPSGLVSFRDYTRSLNPPILHRKELLLVPSHPDRPALEALTRCGESIGLFDDPVRIGFRKQWEELIVSKGYCFVDGQFAPTANDGLSADETQQSGFTGSVQRHRTALSRQFLSAPVQALLRHRVLDTGKTFFDY